MLRILTNSDKETFVKMAVDFSLSNAVLHAYPKENITNTFNQVVARSPLVEGYIYEVEGCVAGYILTSFYHSNEYGGTVAWIDEIYLSANYRGKGLVKHMIEGLVTALEGKAVKLRLEVNNENTAAVRAYKRLDFEDLEYRQMYIDL